ncbi:MAG: glycoside hydrolase family 2 protein [Sedimentisphaerales bacterium]|nr:glycoside hydrolase family 2 protein [Sedimentisphaerales bacterium]
MKFTSVFLSIIVIMITLASCSSGTSTLSTAPNGFIHPFTGGEPREKVALVEWDFCQDKTGKGSPSLPPADTQWTELTIPHVFRQSGLDDYSAGWYRQIIKARKSDREKRFYLFLEGAASVKDVYVNGQHIGQHKGAFTAAAFDLTPAMKFGQDNEVILRVSHLRDEAANCLSKSNLYYTNGGLYRRAWLIKTGAVHIYPDMGSTGVYLTGKDITAEKAALEAKTYVRNPLDKDVEVSIRYIVKDVYGKECNRFNADAKIPAGSIQPVTASAIVKNPKMWDVAKPNLYTVSTELLVNGVRTDAIIERTGFRTIEMKDKSFIFNGKDLIVRGVCKHHQNEHQWNAMTDEQLHEEWDWMSDLGVNMARLAHYPHTRLEYSIADERGIVVWAENGLAGQRWDRKPVTEEIEPTPDGERITREMVRQNWNHPSIIFWSSGNETFQEVASRYVEVIREEDNTRLITYASAGEKPDADFVAGNTYQGWYYAHYMDFQQGNEFCSETGSGCWPSHHIPYGTIKWRVDHFEPEEYTEMFAEFRLQTVFRNNIKGHPMFLWWNMREFYNKKFKGNRNTKGIVTLNGMPKDYYYLFQSFLRPDYPVLHLCGRHHFYRRFEPDNGIKAYSNAAEVELFVNGVSQGKKKNGDYVQPDSVKKVDNKDVTVTGVKIDNVFFWKATLKPGRNLVEVRDNRGLSKPMIIYQKASEGKLPVPKDSLVVNLTSSNDNNPAIFIDRPVEAQGPFYSEVDGSSDNTFDVLPEPVKGSCWITTKRLSESQNKTDLSFKVTKLAMVYVMHSTGTSPAINLQKPKKSIIDVAKAFDEGLTKAGFEDTGIKGIWRGHDCWFADYALWSQKAKAGDVINVPGQTLDYVILIKPL